MFAFRQYLRAVFLAMAVSSAGDLTAQLAYTPRWSSYVGGDFNFDKVSAVAADSATNCYLGGFLGDGYINNDDSVAAPPSYGYDAFAARVSASGALEWYTLFGDTPGGETRGIACGTNQSVIAAGRLSESEATSFTKAFVASLAATNGAVGWVASIGDNNSTNGFNAVATDALGNCFAVGYTSLSNQPCNVPGYQVSGVTYGLQYKGGFDAFVVKLSKSGAVLWRHYLGGANTDRATAVAVTPDGYVYVGGETASSNWVTLASGVSPSPSNTDGFIVKLAASNGAHVWSAFLGGGAAGDAVHALAVDPAIQAVYVGGTTASGNFLSGANRLNSHAGGASDGFVVRLTDTNTAFRTDWCRFLGSNGTDRVNALALKADGQVAAGGALGVSGNQNGFFAFLTASGSVLWPSSVGGSRADEVFGLATAPETLYAAGSTFSSDGWAEGGFWNTWSKFEEWGGGDFGFVGKWMLGEGVAPSITSDLADLTVVEGDPAALGFAVTGTEALIYRWFRNGQPLAGAASNLYAIAAAAVSNNNDTYACLVSNYWGAATTRTATLTVLAKGALTVSLSPSQAVAQGARWSFNGGAAWLDSGVITNLAPGAYTVTCLPLAGWRTPAAVSNVTVSSSQTASLTGAYAAILPSAERAVSGTNVTLTVRAPAGLSTWTLVETLQDGITPVSITGGGVWNSGARTLTFTGAEATTNTVSYSAVCVTSGLYSVSGTVTPQPSGIPSAVAGPAQILKANLVRTISGNSVTITVYQPSSSFIWSVYESLAGGLTPTNITGPSAEWDPGMNEISWFRKGVGVTLSYQVTGEPGTYTLSGYGHVSALDEPIFGDSTLTIPYAVIPTPDILGFAPVPGESLCSLTFTSLVNQAYVILTNAAPGATNGWATCLPVTGGAGTTQREVPMSGPRLFYRVRAVQ